MEPRLKNGIAVERDFGELPAVRCYAGQLNQVFMNLLMNACDAIDGRGKITVRTRPVEDGVLLEFEDDGPGMPPEVRSRDLRAVLHDQAGRARAPASASRSRTASSSATAAR